MQKQTERAKALTGRGLVFRLLLVAIVLLLLGLLALAGIQYARSAAEPASGTPTTLSSAATSSATAITPLRLPVVAPPPTSTGPHAIFDTPTLQVAGGISIEVRGAQRDGDLLRVDLCYQLPTPALNWQLSRRPGEVTVQAQGNTLRLASDSFISWQTSPTSTAPGGATGACDQITFTAPAALDLTHFTLSIARLMTSPTESPDCAAAQDRLNRANTGIVIACHTGPGSFSFELVTKPVTLTTDDAVHLVTDTFSDFVSGPWVFTGHLPPAAPAPTLDPAASPTAADPRAYGAHPDTLVFTRRNEYTSATLYQLLPLDCLSRPGGCAQAPRIPISVPATDVLDPAVWSPAGDAFIFLAGLNGRADIYRANVDGSGLTDLTPTPGTRGSLAWSPDGQWLLWGQPGAAPNTGETWLMRPDGTQPRKLAEGGDAALLPDSSGIVYAVEAGTRYQVNTLSLQPGAPPVRLLDLPNPIATPRLAPGGGALAFTAVHGIYVLGLTGAALPLTQLNAPGLIRLSPAGLDAAGPVWSPDGRSLAYAASDAPHSPPAVYVAAADGSSNLNVSNLPDGLALSPAWSLDGERLAFVAESNFHSNVYLVNPDGTDLIPLTLDPANTSPTLYFDQPSWRP